METSTVKQTEKILNSPVINKCDMVENNKANAPKKKNTFALKLFFKILILVLLITFLVRAPYVGSYVDGLIDYLLGQAKYGFYALGIFAMIALIYNGRIARIIKTPKFIIFSALALLSIGCIISGCYDLSKFFKQHPSFTERMSSYHSAWKSYFLQHSYSNYFNNFISGGILAVLLSFLFNFVSYAILVLFAVITLIICIFIIFNINYKSTKLGLKLRGWLVRKLGGSFKYDGYDELRDNADNQNKFKKTSKQQIEAASSKDEIDFDLLPDTDINHDNQNWKKGALIQTKIANLFRQEGVDCVASDINIYTSFTELCFETKSNSDVKQIVKLQEEISKVSKLDKFNISYRGNVLSIEYDNLYFSKLSLRSASHLTKHKPLTAFFGITKDKHIAEQEFKLSPSAIIIGKKGSGSGTLSVLMMLSICLNTKPEDLDLVILSPNCEQTYSAFVNLPHTSGKIFESLPNVTNKLHDLQNIINQRSSLLQLNNVSNIDQYNRITNDSTSRMKNVLVFISNGENAIKETFQNSKIIEELLVNGPKVGIYTIIQSYAANPELLDPAIFNNVSDKYIFTLENADQSKKIFDSGRASQLHANGDCLHFVKDKIRNMERIQVCNINKEETNADIDIIKTFYTIKEQKPAIQAPAIGENNDQRII